MIPRSHPDSEGPVRIDPIVINPDIELSGLISGTTFETLSIRDIHRLSPAQAGTLSSDLINRIAGIPEKGPAYKSQILAKAHEYSRVLNAQRIAAGSLPLFPANGGITNPTNIYAINKAQLPLAELLIHCGRPTAELRDSAQADVIILNRLRGTFIEEKRLMMQDINIWKLLPTCARDMLNIEVNLLPNTKSPAICTLLERIAFNPTSGLLEGALLEVLPKLSSDDKNEILANDEIWRLLPEGFRAAFTKSLVRTLP